MLPLGALPPKISKNQNFEDFKHLWGEIIQITNIKNLMFKVMYIIDFFKGFWGTI